jgi:hypothetical protein
MKKALSEIKQHSIHLLLTHTRQLMSPPVLIVVDQILI